ncbi:hypothetical protein [Dolosicoccus paucivorans]|uniref:hypothetical protein n=1 Tax=Dolosicoccus paucivorans TaxID=84521 RepID=UPI00087F7B44|nr:hypothetical protein [Dolosicoccus paucivorans]SDI82096.1 hypothetical protein SAMN04487994_10529 [Dolosicoccus paucivorans]
MRLGQEKLLLTIMTVLSISLSFIIIIIFTQGQETLTRLLVGMMMILFQLRTSIVQLFYKRRELTFHRFKPLEHSVLVDLIATGLYMNVLPVILLWFHYILVPSGRFDWLFTVIYIVYLIFLSLNFWAETQRFLCKQSDETENYRLVGLWRRSWNFNYFTETFILPLLVFAGTGDVLMSLIVLSLMAVNFIHYQIPKNEYYIKNAYPHEAGIILKQSSYLPSFKS